MSTSRAPRRPRPAEAREVERRALPQPRLPATPRPRRPAAPARTSIRAPRASCARARTIACARESSPRVEETPSAPRRSNAMGRARSATPCATRSALATMREGSFASSCGACTVARATISASGIRRSANLDRLTRVAVQRPGCLDLSSGHAARGTRNARGQHYFVSVRRRRGGLRLPGSHRRRQGQPERRGTVARRRGVYAHAAGARRWVDRDEAPRAVAVARSAAHDRQATRLTEPALARTLEP